MSLDDDGWSATFDTHLHCPRMTQARQTREGSFRLQHSQKMFDQAMTQPACRSHASVAGQAHATTESHHADTYHAVASYDQHRLSRTHHHLAPMQHPEQRLHVLRSLPAAPTYAWPSSSKDARHLADRAISHLSQSRVVANVRPGSRHSYCQHHPNDAPGATSIAQQRTRPSA